MAQRGYFSCICCGRLYKEDGSESDLYELDHGLLKGALAVLEDLYEPDQTSEAPL